MILITANSVDLLVSLLLVFVGLMRVVVLLCGWFGFMFLLWVL